MVALVDVASDAVSGLATWHRGPTSAAVWVGGTYARTRPSGGTGPKSGGGGGGEVFGGRALWSFNVYFMSLNFEKL